MFSGGSDNDWRRGEPGGSRPDDDPGTEAIATGNGSGRGDNHVDIVHLARYGTGADSACGRHDPVFIGSAVTRWRQPGPGTCR